MALRGAALQRAARFFVPALSSPAGASISEENALNVQLRRSGISSLIPPHMIHWLRTIRIQFARLFKRPQASVDRSQLVGMYLSQANRPSDSIARGSGTRERQEGKFSQNRRRG